MSTLDSAAAEPSSPGLVHEGERASVLTSERTVASQSELSPSPEPEPQESVLILPLRPASPVAEVDRVRRAALELELRQLRAQLSLEGFIQRIGE